MWIIRFHLLQTKHYNKIHRICKKYGFITRKISPLVYSKALLLHTTQKTSWRTLGNQFWVDHILLYRFSDFSCRSDMYREILHVFLESRSALYIGDSRQVHIESLNNSSEIYNLTKREFESMLDHII